MAWLVCCVLVRGTIVFRLPYLDGLRLFSLTVSQSLRPHNLYVSRMKDLREHWVN